MATVCLAHLAKEDPAALRLVIGVLKDPHPDVRATAAASLGGLGAREAIPALIDMLRDKELWPREQARNALARIGPDAIPALVKALPTLEAAAGAALGEMGEPALPALIAALKHPPHRVAAAVGLAVLGPRAAPAVPELIVAMTDNDSRVRSLALQAIQRVGPAAAGAVPVLIATLDDSEKALRFEAISALGSLGPKAGSAVEAEAARSIAR